MKTLFLAWQEPFSRRWFPVGRLTSENGRYSFTYTQGSETAQEHGFTALPAFPDRRAIYESSELFPLFSNRIMPRSRPDYPDFVKWLTPAEHDDDPFALLALSGGQRATGDTLTVYPCPIKNGQGLYHIHFLVHGLQHLGEASLLRTERLESGETLYLLIDAQNPHDPHALMLRTADAEGAQLVGWFPRYLAADIKKLLDDPQAVAVTVERVNLPPAPLQFRLLCSLTVNWPDGFSPFSGDEYQPLVTQETPPPSQALAFAS